MARKRFFRRRSYRASRRSGRRVKNIGLGTIGVGINAGYQMGFVPAGIGLLNGTLDAEGALNTVRNAATPTNVLEAVGPVVGLALVKKFIGRVPLIKFGSWQINLL